uniref:ATP synthase complex subunit 8 n=1 Tax=Exechia fusca TaxID=1601820 RepID=A0A7D6W917_9DIPT|nr:ATP synthase F0 subunit 8 [Exechia fusca]
MPQMAPINWLSLFFMFTIIYLIFNILNYFNYFLSYPINNKQQKKNQTSYLNWKW